MILRQRIRYERRDRLHRLEFAVLMLILGSFAGIATMHFIDFLAPPTNVGSRPGSPPRAVVPD